MFVKVGLHRKGPTIYVRSPDFAELEARGFGAGGGKRASVQVLEQHLEILPSNYGPHFQATNARDAGEGWDFVLRDEQAVHVRSHNFVTKAQWFGPKLVVDMLLPHLLPWPKEYDAKHGRDRIVGDLRARITSSLQHTGSPRISIPGNVVEVLTQQEQERLFQEWAI